MNSPKSPRLRLLACLLAVAPSAQADWTDDIGYQKLKAELGAACPKGAGVKVTQVEARESASGPYAPAAGTGSVAGAGNFIGQTFLLKSGTSGESAHALIVGNRIYGTYGTATSVANVDVYEVNDWVGTGFLKEGSNNLPLAETSQVQNHSWIGFPDSGEETIFKKILERVDYSINNADPTNRYLVCVGMNNYGGTIVPVLMATAFNVISVGLSDGTHSHGLTVSPYGGTGRSKPQIVAPSDATSFATGMVSGVGACLRGAATTANGRRTETLRAVMLAGATKEQFPTWSRTTTQPIDTLYGAGQVNIYHSYKILSTAEQTSSPTTPVALNGWDLSTITNGSTSDYVIVIPAALSGASLSAALVWNSSIVPVVSLNLYNRQPLPNLSLTLYKGTGNPGTQIDQSNSAVDNLEHLWQPSLTCGTYRIRISGDATQSPDATLAWRVTAPAFSPTIAIGPAVPAQPIPLNFTHLVPTQAYLIETATSLQSWTTAHSFTAASATFNWSAPAPSGPRHFYRLKWSCP